MSRQGRGEKRRKEQDSRMRLGRDEADIRKYGDCRASRMWYKQRSPAKSNEGDGGGVIAAKEAPNNREVQSRTVLCHANKGESDVARIFAW